MNNNTRTLEAREREITLDNMHPSRILHHIHEHAQDSQDYLVLIMGTHGPTGKTWLCDGLKHYGFNAVEITEDICDYVLYLNDYKNHYYINPSKKLVIIVLNELLNKEKNH